MSKPNKFIEKYKRCIYEYTNTAGAFSISEDGEEDMNQPMGDDPMGGNAPMGGDSMGDDPMGGNAPMGGDPMGGDPMGGDSMGGDPMGSDAPMGGDPMGGDADNQANAPEGFNPENNNPNDGLEGMGGESENDDEDSMESDDEVIDVDDLTKSQESAEKKIDKMNHKFEKLMKSVEELIRYTQRKDEATEDIINKVKGELDKRIPTPQQRLSMRSVNSSPYTMTPNEYMNNYAPENYSAEDDNNGADDYQYKITKSDIDKFTDYNSIAKDLDIEHQGIKDILEY